MPPTNRLRKETDFDELTAGCVDARRGIYAAGSIPLEG